MRITVLLFILFLTTLTSTAQVQLKIADAENRRPLREVLIRNLQSGEELYTDSTGTVSIPWSLPAKAIVYLPNYSSRQLLLSDSSRLKTVLLSPLTGQLPEVIVEAYEQHRSILEIPGSIQYLSPEEIGRFDQTSLLASVNVVPGVRLEQRSPGSYRVSIRGSSIRAPFGVRNVKVYWNGIPFTEPGGDTQLNFLDLANIDQVEIIKGPAGSLYGAGTGGALLLDTETGPEGVEAGYLGGSYGLQRLYAKAKVEEQNNHYGIRVAHQQTDGYRDHSEFSRSLAQLHTEHQLDEHRQLELNLLYTNLHYQIPGGLNPEQYRENPRQARPGSAEKNASINYDILISGLSHEWENNNWRNLTTLYSYLHYFDHPFNTDYKKESTLGGGGRSIFQYSYDWGRSSTTLTAGGEYQLQQRAALNFDNEEGKPDTLNFSDEILSNQYLLFAQAEVELPQQWLLTAGLSYNRLRYTIDRLYSRDGFMADDGLIAFEPALAVRIGASKVFRPELSLHGSISQGFSPPGLDEVRTNEGSLNTQLAPEQGWNYEAGIRGHLLYRRLYYDLTTFWFNLNQTIVSYQDASGVVLFRNTGSTLQQGVELWLDYLILKPEKGFLEEMRFRQSYTYHRFLYQEYVQAGQNFEGNYIPGVAPHTLASSISLDSRTGLDLQADWQYVADIPLNDANVVYADSYHLLKIKLGYQIRVNEFSAEVFTGADNLLNEVYSLGNDTNPQYGERYFQPAAARSFFAGIRLQF